MGGGGLSLAAPPWSHALGKTLRITFHIWQKIQSFRLSKEISALSGVTLKQGSLPSATDGFGTKGGDLKSFEQLRDEFQFSSTDFFFL